MNCTDLKEHLMPFADGELEPRLAAEVEKALTDCPEAREELAEIRRIGALSRHAFLAPVEAVNLAGVYDGVMARLQAENAAERKQEQPGVWARFVSWCSEVIRFERPMVLAGAAAAALAVVIGFSLSGGAPTPGPGGPGGNGPSVAGPGDPVEMKRRGAEEEVKAAGKHTAFVEHLEADKGKAYVEFDQNDPEAPMVLWHLVEDDGAPTPKGL